VVEDRDPLHQLPAVQVVVQRGLERLAAEALGELVAIVVDDLQPLAPGVAFAVGVREHPVDGRQVGAGTGERDEQLRHRPQPAVIEVVASADRVGAPESFEILVEVELVLALVALADLARVPAVLQQLPQDVLDLVCGDVSAAMQRAVDLLGHG
jgi:hypothetical protein